MNSSSSGGDAGEEGYEQPQWFFVSDWPQVPGHLRDTLDAELIPKHAVAALRRALDFKQVIGFIGSGVSMSYGRLSWGELIRWLAQSVQRPRDWEFAGLQPLDGVRKRTGGEVRPLTQTQQLMKRLLTDLGIDKPERSPDIQSGRLPAAFQFLEQFSREMERSEGTQSSGESRVRRMLRALLRDDAGQAYLLIEQLIDDLAAGKTKREDKQCIALFEAVKDPQQHGAVRSLTEPWRLLHHYLDESAKQDSQAWTDFGRNRSKSEEAKSVSDDWRAFFSVTPQRVKEFAERMPAASIARELCEHVALSLADTTTKEGGPLAPLHRFVVTALIRLDPLLACESLLPQGPQPDGTSQRLRSLRIAEGRDPLLMLLRDFGIDRLATTNYDLDIEQALFDLGFDAAGPQPRGTAERATGLSRNALGVPAHDSVFAHDHAAELLRFANARPAGIEVMHMHGRVFPGEPLVVTEGDYQAMYLQRTDAAEAAAEAIALTMRSNTVLFLGSGMGEDDILRPMRQFVTERRSRADRSGVVLLPADNTVAREVEDVIALYSRYGVLTKHFGVGDSKGRRVRWLAHGVDTCWRLQSMVRIVCEALDLPSGRRRRVDKLRKDVRERPWAARLRKQLNPSEINGLPSDQLVRSLGLGDTLEQTAEITMLRAVAKAARQLRVAAVRGSRCDSELEESHALRRLGDCLLALLAGLDGALRALAMMLELASLNRGWLEWKQDRTIAPRHRPVGAQRDPPGATAESGTVMFVYTRNRLALRVPVDRMSEVPATDRFRQNAPSHSFSRFIAGLRSPGAQQPAARQVSADQVGGRRIFLLLARRGLGKGHFFEMMAERSRTAEFIAASWSKEGPPAQQPPAYAGACFVNLGVSLEFLSAFDWLGDALVEMATRVFPAAEVPAEIVERILRADRRLKHNRLARLQAVLGLYAEHAEQAKARVLLAINGFAQLFDRHGAPKNAQLHRLIEALFGKDGKPVPIDLLIICQDDEIPGRFRRKGVCLPIKKNKDLDRWSEGQCDPMGHIAESRPEERLRRKLDQAVEPLHLAGEAFGGDTWVHVLRGAQASATVGKYFPDVALAVALGPVVSKLEIVATPREVRALQEKIAKHFAAQKKAHDDRQEKGGAIRPPMVGIDKTTLAILARLIAPIDVSKASTWSLSDLAPDPGLEALIREAGAADSFGGLDPSINDRFGELHRGVRSNRFLLTIACAAASERGWREPTGGENLWRFEIGAVTEWLRTLRLETSNHLPDDTVDMIIGMVLLSHQQGHEKGRLPAFFGLGAAGQPEAVGEFLASLRSFCAEVMPDRSRQLPAAGEVPKALYGPLSWRLQQRLLWHMAVTALEVQDDVLATAPLVERDCMLLAEELLGVSPERLKLHDMRRRGVFVLLVRLMMDLLVHRCLVFRMDPVQLYPTGQPSSLGKKTDALPARPTHTGWRFSIHRFLQRTILKQLKSPFVEFPRVDQFGLSMWATQPDELPRPHRSAAHDIADLVAAWVGFPKNGEALRLVSVFHWYRRNALEAAQRLQQEADWRSPVCRADWRNVTLPARMLRAALGVLRATYSVGVVSHFHDFDDDGGGLSAPADGYFKQHHLQVRWLLEQAKKIGQEDVLTGLLSQTTGGDDRGAWRGVAEEAVAPFFVDELVWLNNECGLFCLVEGRLQNAAGMFRQALLAAEQVEGRDRHGALWCRVSLNLAIVDIERGRIRDAEQRLRAIQEVDDENPILRILARGFLALVQHLSGQLDQAAVVYLSVIEDLVALGQLRSVAIFSRHLAELRRLQGHGATEPAWRAVEQSLSAATRGGHEDIRHLALLSRVRLAISNVLPAEVLRREKAAIQTNLDAIERYGHTMGMPRLLAEVAFARALYLLDLGDTRHAARLAFQCLGLCAANGLQLRHMMGTALLGRIYQRRGMSKLAEPLLMQASAMAAEFHYGNLREPGGEAGAIPSAMR